MKNPMYASLLKYAGVPQLAEELIKKQDDLKTVLRRVHGFNAFYLLKTNDGAVSLTVCEDRPGVEESNRVSAAWLKDKLPTFAARTPEITIGELQIQVLEPTAKTSV